MTPEEIATAIHHHAAQTASEPITPGDVLSDLEKLLTAFPAYAPVLLQVIKELGLLAGLPK